jgi:hypothetical protein
LIKELETELNQGKAETIREADRITLEARLKELEREEDGYHRQNAKGMLSDDKLQKYLTELAESKTAIEKHLNELEPQEEEPKPLPSKDPKGRVPRAEPVGE